MRKSQILIIAILSTFAIIFTACPYSSNVPLSNAEIKVDPSIYGKWLKVDAFTDFPKYFVFSKIDGNKFHIEEFEYSSSDSMYNPTGVYESHFTQIGNITFANMLQDGHYYFYKIDFTTANEFSLYEVTDNIDEVFNSSEEIYAYFEKNKNLSFFYNKDEYTYKFQSEEEED